MPDKIFRLSKSQYLSGLQCPKALWLYRHRPDLKPPISEQKHWLFDSGHEVGNLAQQNFGDGQLIDEQYYETDKAIQSINDAVAAGTDVIFEAAAESPDGAFSKIDIFQKTNDAGQWDLIEVKQSTDVKDYHIDDISLQRYAFTNAGYKVRKSILMHVNRDYVRYGEFLHTDTSDPRAKFTKALIDSCGTNGSVIVYNKGFESRINRELAAHFPHHQAFLDDINARMVDLLVPFKSRFLYHPKMNGSASIKKVLPAFVPELDYDVLESNDGDAAFRNYMKCLKGIVTGAEMEKIYRDLREYCEMDTLAEVKLIEKLYEYAG